MSVLKSHIKMISSNCYADKQGLYNTCQFPECNSCIFGAVVPLSVILFHVLSETMPVPSTPLFCSKEQLQNRKRTVTFPYSFLTYLHLFHFSALTNLWTISCRLWCYWKAFVYKAFRDHSCAHENQVTYVYLHLLVFTMWMR